MRASLPLNLPRIGTFRALLTLAAVLAAPQLASAQTTYYWDSNSTTAGFGNTNGTWGTSTFWSTSSAGTGSTANTTITNLDDVNFGTASDGYTGTVTISGTQTANSLTYGSASGAVTLSGGTFNLGNANTIITQNSASTATINSIIGGGTNGLTKSGTGGLSLLGANTFSGGVILNAGTLYTGNNASAFGTGRLTINGGRIDIATSSSAAGTALTTTNANTWNGSWTMGRGSTGTATWNNNGDVLLGGNVTVSSANNSTNLKLGGVISDGGNNYGLAFGLSTTTLSNSNNSYTGATTINAGTLSINSVANAGSNSPIGAYAGTDRNGLVLNGGTLSYTGGDATTNRGFTMTASSMINVTGTGVTLQMGLFDAPTMTGSQVLTVGGGAGSKLTIGTYRVSPGVNLTINPSIAVRLNNLVFAASGSGNFGTSTNSNLTVGSITGEVANPSVTLGGNGGTIDTSVSIGTGTFSKAGGGTWTFTGTSFTANSISIANNGGGGFTVGGSGSLGTAGLFGGTIGLGSTAGGFFTYNSSATQTLSGVISGGGTLAPFTKSGSGILTLSGANTYNSTTALTAGTLQVGVNSVGSVGSITSSAIGKGTLALNGGTLSSNGTTTRTLLNALTFGGDVTLGDATNSGALTFSASGDLGGATRTLTTNSAVTFGGTLSNGGLTKAGASTLTLNGANTYTGLTTVTAGTLQYGANDVISSGGVTVNGGTLAMQTFSDSVGAVTLSGGSITTTGGSVLTSTVGFDVQSGSASAAFAGNVGLTKSTSGTVTLSGANTYTGATQVNAGTLLVNGSTAAGSAVTVGGASASGTPTLGGTGIINGSVTISLANGGAAGTLSPGNGSGGKLTLGNGLSMQSGSTLNLVLSNNSTAGTVSGGQSSQNLSNPTANNYLSITSGSTTIDPNTKFFIDGTGLTFNPATTYSYKIALGAGDQSSLNINSIDSPSQFSFANFSNSADFAFSVTGDVGGVYLNVVPVPEPAAVLGIAVAAFGLGGFVRRRFKKTPADTNATIAA